MRPLYGEPEANNYWFAIYYPHYKEDNPANIIIKSVSKFSIEGIILTNKATIRLEGWVKQ